MENTDLLEDLLSRDPLRIARASSKICKSNQEMTMIEFFIPHYQSIKEATSNIELGGMIAPNKRFLDKMFRIFDYYKNPKGCSCVLFSDDDPHYFEKLNNVRIVEIIYYENSNYVDYYKVECLSCHKLYKVMEYQHHFTSYQWSVDIE